jgi:hypothetical protein
MGFQQGIGVLVIYVGRWPIFASALFDEMLHVWQMRLAAGTVGCGACPGAVGDWTVKVE